MLNPALARETLQVVVRQVREGTFPYQSRPTPWRNWSLYDRAQTHEAGDLLALLAEATRELTHRVPTWGESWPSARKGGRPPIPTAPRVAALLWQSYRGVANRPAAAELRLVANSLGLARPFSYGTIAHAYHDPEVLVALRSLLWLTNEPILGKEWGFAVDGSGFSTTVDTHYGSHRSRQRGAGREEGAFPTVPAPWVRNVANVGLRFGMVAGWKSWVDPRLGELSAFEEVFRSTVRLHPEARIQLGDGLYAARWVVGRVAEAGMVSRFLPRRDVTLKCLGEPAWPKSLWGLVKEPQDWLEEYHLRSRVESFWGALKARNPEKIRKRAPHARVVEATLRAVVHNLRQLCYWHWVAREEFMPDPTDSTIAGS